jgi:hypothetical protein
MTGKRVSEMTDDEVREMATGIGRDYFDLMNHLRDARAALTRAEQTLDLIGPNDLPRHVALDDLVLSIQTSADLIGRRTGTDARRRGADQAAGRAHEPTADPSDFMAVANRGRLLSELFGGGQEPGQ